ncbi:MAG: allantoicase, partial [Actinomycetota bacterium]|nr:allantoicase [Actinomycetota bacterium]
MKDFTALPDLASRRLGGSVVAANDEAFAERQNLIKAEPPTFRPYTFGPHGQVYDGWETRRRREPGHDWAIVRLGLPGVVRGVIVDTSYFTGNYPPEVSVEGAAVEGYPPPTELEGAEWLPLVPRSPVGGDAAFAFPVDVSPRMTHVRLSIYPDGGVARLRVHGNVVADPRLLAAGPVDLAALANGGTVTGCSNAFYSSPTALISPGEARVMGEGWETARRRDDGNDWVEFALTGAGTIGLAELDTSHFVANAPGWAALRGRSAPDADWGDLLPRQRLQPDTVHRLRLTAGPEVTQVRLDVFPDGGMARVRLWGVLSSAARDALAARWFDLLPAGQARAVLTN